LARRKSEWVVFDFEFGLLAGIRFKRIFVVEDFRGRVGTSSERWRRWDIGVASS
jgi:hypothetical protein